MIHTYTAKGPRRYRYYVCSSSQKWGRDSCPTKSIPAEEIEGFVWCELDGDSHLSGQLGPRDGLSTCEQAKRLAELVERIDYDGRQGDLAIRFIANGKATS